jgi:hypothetical protein
VDRPGTDFLGTSRRAPIFASLAPREIGAGAALALVVISVFVALALAVQDNRAVEPEFEGGGAFLTWVDRSPPSFNVVDGRPEIRVQSLIPRFFDGRGDVNSLRPVNSSAGVYLVDIAQGRVRSFDLSYRARGDEPGQQQSGSSVIDVTGNNGAVAYAGATAGRLFVISASPDGRSVTLTTVTPDSAEFDRADGTVSLPGRFLGSDQVAASGETVWIAVGDADVTVDSVRLYRVDIGEPSPAELASVTDDERGDNPGGGTPGADLRRLPAEPVATSFPGDAVLVALEGKSQVASASATDQIVRIHRTGQAVSEVNVPELADATIRPLRGGGTAWFLAFTGSTWKVINVAPTDGSKRVSPLGPETASRDFVAGAIVGNHAVTVDAGTGLVAVLGLDEVGAAPVVPPRYFNYDTAAESGPDGNVGGGNFEVVAFAGRAWVNAGERDVALMVAPGPQLTLLDKGSVPETATDDGEGPGTPLPERGKGDPDPLPGSSQTLYCEQTENIILPPILLSQERPSAPKSISPRWQYQGTTSDFCVPTADVIVSRDGREVRRAKVEGISAEIDGLDVNAEYEVVVEAVYNRDKAGKEIREPSSPERYRTSEAGPCPVQDPTAPVNRERTGWSVSWTPPKPSDADCGGSVLGYEVRVAGVDDGPRSYPRISATEFFLPFDGFNLGLSPEFTITAVGPNGGLSVKSVTGEPGKRPPDCGGLRDRLAPVPGSGPDPEFGVLVSVENAFEYYGLFGSRDGVELFVGPTRVPILLSPIKLNGSATPGRGSPNADWAMDVTFAGCDEAIAVRGKNTQLPCDVRAVRVTYVVTPRTDAAFEWQVTPVAGSAPGCATVTFDPVTGTPGQCATRAGNSFTVSRSCTSPPRFDLKVEPNTGYAIEGVADLPSQDGPAADDFRPASEETDIKAIADDARAVEVSCSLEVNEAEALIWECTLPGTETPVEFKAGDTYTYTRPSLTNFGPWWYTEVPPVESMVCTLKVTRKPALAKATTVTPVKKPQTNATSLACDFVLPAFVEPPPDPDPGP